MSMDEKQAKRTTRAVKHLRAAQEPGTWLSINEFAQRMGCSTKTARERLHLAREAGLVGVCLRERLALDGKWYSCPVYRVYEDE